ncbi:hypothetical protein [Niabella ginsengisoli]|uniref:Uncharacterized protein n=1 Tax=Niabella ginsengisoli TaxID=522298 RepID=A0ABS9SKR2_9BACT|nr:hypothetical protein [Niabella ginsengisoli]MCH5598979.1 hypothetical protein [Niabella ginsengisoli]
MLDSTDLDELTDEKVFTDVENTRRALINLYGNMRQASNNNSGSFSQLFDMNVTVAMLDNATDDGAGNTTRNAGISPGIQKYITGAISGTSNPVVLTHPWRFFTEASATLIYFLPILTNAL